MTKSKQFLDIPLMDTSIRPGQNFFKYVNGKWLEQVEIPNDRERWGSFDELRKRTDINTQALIDGVRDGRIQTKDSDTLKAIDFIKVALDTEAINQLGIQLLEGLLDQISTIKDHSDLAQFIENETKNGFSFFFSLSVFPDLLDSKVNTLYLSGAHLGLPERDYYIKDDPEDQAIRKDYLVYMNALLRKVGQEHVDASSILDFETKVAQILLSKEDSRNPQNIYHPHSIDELGQTCTHFDWNKIFDSLSLDIEKLIVTEKLFFKEFDKVLGETKIETLKSYLTFTLVNSLSPYLASAYEEARFDFYGKRLGGAKEMKPRKERIIDVINSVLGEAIGKLYVEEYFPPEAKENAAELVQYVKEAFGARIKNLSWMNEGTKLKALEKLSSFGVKIAYPDQWKDYSKLDIISKENGGTYLGNILNVQQWKMADDFSKVGKPVDKDEWHMPPQMVNAYYSPLSNEIVFPAAILQSPFYALEADPAVNFGGIGAVIAHEMTHGFDDQGRKFDKDGNMVEWWTKEDQDHFSEKTEKLVKQADKFEILEGLYLNGTFTLGENLADLGGVLIAYDAMINYLKDHEKPAEIDGYSQEQRFFISWATVWRGKTRQKALRKQIAIDPHPPFEFRALNPLSNVESFYHAFHVVEKDEMFLPKEDRVKVW